MEQGSLKPKKYMPRLVDRLLSRALDDFGAVEVYGPMWCGKTWTSLSFGRSVTRLAEPDVRRVAEADPSIALLGDRPHVIDEWQDVPSVWDAVRNFVDDSGGEAGLFILTGSSSLKRDAVAHSGAGRILRVPMSTMTLAETGESSGKVSLSGLFEGRFEPQLVQQKLPELASIICRGGWPALQGKSKRAATAYIDSYFDAVFDVNIPKRGLGGQIARRVALSLARNVGTSAKLETIAEDVFSERPTDAMKNAVSEYITAFERLYLIRPIRGWDAPIRSKSRLRVKPKRYFSDPSLAANLLRTNDTRLLEDGQLFGILFESLCMHDLSAYASLLPEAPRDALHYYRDSDGLEVDAVIELRDGRWAAFEVKLGEAGVDAGIDALLRLKRKVSLNPAARNPSPEFLAVLTGAGEVARYDKEAGAYVIPVTALAP
ncbi:MULTISPECIES: ATP-binding protein [unclassified Adlercreutzia]|uniref:ATP-binding protein n=1 Tax=unclassified Adlercreutzia TaxID=2636013 RepID=UPI0013EC4A92|nr:MULTISPECIES: DUF4143 domain-containing protein [unclassified Adlercreutzia]